MQVQYSKKVKEVKCTSVSWKQQCLSLLDSMLQLEDSTPFRYPVNINEYPDYKAVIDRPMDLSTLRENLCNNHYRSPTDFSEDMRLIFHNSRIYNTNIRSRIYSMTIRISAMFEEHFRSIMSKWRSAVILEENLRLNSHTCLSSVKKEEIPSVEESSAKLKVSTLVFMDLETTGLPFDVGKNNVQIVELCMIAIDRLSFERDTEFRVLNKINLCVQPRFDISPGATDVSGLYNEMLENQLEFDETVPPLLEYFFRRLKKPICLLAHNGKRFDFPILQAELNRVNYTLSPDVMCADTMTAFRAICLLVKQASALEAEENAMKEKVNAELERQVNKNKIFNDRIKSALSQDLESSINTIESVSADEKHSEFGVPKVSAPKSILENYTIPEKESSFERFLSSTRNPQIPQISNYKSDLSGNINEKKWKIENNPLSEGRIEFLLPQFSESSTTFHAASLTKKRLEFRLPKVSTTKSKPESYTTETESVFEKFLSPSQNTEALQNLPLDIVSDLSDCVVEKKRKMPDSTCPPKKKYKYSKKKMIEAKRKLVLEEHHDSLELHKITSFALKNLYKHFFHAYPPNSHCAEFDCINLSKICQKVRKNFLNWIDENSVSFSSIKALW